jgi:hypothetical protein
MPERTKMESLWDSFDKARKSPNVGEAAWATWWRGHLFTAIRIATPDGWDGVLVTRDTDLVTGTLVADGRAVARLTFNADGQATEWVEGEGS